jgi:hypothetical protein
LKQVFEGHSEMLGENDRNSVANGWLLLVRVADPTAQSERRTGMRSNSLAVFLAPLLATASMAVHSANADQDVESVIRREIQGLNAGDVSRVLDTFSPDALIHQLPQSEDHLVGARSHKIGTQSQRNAQLLRAFTEPLQPATDLVDIAVVGSFAVVKLRTVRPMRPTKQAYSLFVYRVEQGQIHDLWQVARADADSDGSSAITVIRRLVAASNRGDADTFVPLFSPDAKHFRSSGNPRSIGKELIERLSGRNNLTQTIREAFSRGAPPRATIVNAFALGELVVSHDQVALPKGNTLRQLKIYRVRNGTITHDWTVHEQRTG